MTFEFGPREPTFFAEAELMEYVGELPTVTPELRHQVVSAAKRACRHAQLLQRIQIAAAAVLFCTGGVLLGGFYLSMWSGEADRWAVASASPDQQTLSHDGNEVDNSGSNTGEVTPRDQLLLASRAPDVWALVDAYGAFRLHGMKKLQIVLQ